MKFPRRGGCRPALASGDLGDLHREAAEMILGLEFVEWSIIFPADQRGPRKLADNLIPFLAGLLLKDLFQRLELGHALDPFLALELLLQALGRPGAFGDVIDLVAQAHFEIDKLRIHCGGHIARERPGRRRPDEQVLLRSAAEREGHKDRPMGDEPVTLMHFHLTQADAAARTPGHGVVTAIDQVAGVTLLEEAPDRVVVLIGHGEVATPRVRRLLPVHVAVPVHPVTEADRLLRLQPRERIHARFAEVHKAVDAGKRIPRDQVFDVAL